MARSYPMGRRWTASILAAALLITAPGPGAVEALAAMRIAASAGKAPVGAALKIPAINSRPVFTGLALPSSGLRRNLQESRLSGVSALGAEQASIQQVVAAEALPAGTIVAAAEKPSAVGSLAEQRQAFAVAVKRSAKQGTTGAQAKAEFDQLFEGAGFTGPPGVAAKASAPKRRWLRKTLIVAGGATSVVVPAVVLVDMGAAGAGAVPILPGLAGILNLASWSPVALVAAVAVLPFALYLVPALAKAFHNRRAAVMRRVVRQVRAKPSRIEKDGSYLRYVLERKRRLRNGGTFTDRFIIVRVPAGERRLSAELRSHVIIESEMLRSANGGHPIQELLKFEYDLKGKPVADGSFVHNALHYFSGNQRAARKVLSRWAPNGSGKLSLLLLGAAASLPAFLLAGTTVHPLDAFVGMAVGALVGIGVRCLMESKRLRERFGGWASRTATMIAILSPAAVFYFFQLPVMKAYTISLLVSLILARYWPDTGLRLPSGPARADLRRSGSAFGKVKFALIALLAFAAMANVINPRPADAGERAMIAKKMDIGETGSEYARYLREHPDLSLYLVQPWHNEDMGDALAFHDAAISNISRAKIVLNAEAYGIRSESWIDFDLALSALVHELDHDKQDDDTGGVPPLLSGEHSAWDHQARFILEQFEKTPDIFKPGDENDNEKYRMLRSAQRWLNAGPAFYRSYVSGLYTKTPELEDYKGAGVEAWKSYYEQHRAEMQSAWEARKGDVELKMKLRQAAMQLIMRGAEWMDAPEIRLGAGTLLGAFFGSLLSLLSLLGIERLIPVLRRVRRRRARKS